MIVRIPLSNEFYHLHERGLAEARGWVSQIRLSGHLSREGFVARLSGIRDYGFCRQWLQYRMIGTAPHRKTDVF